MSGLVGDVSKLSRLASSLRAMPTKVAQRIAEQVAPKLTELARETFDAGETPYGDKWLPGVDGRSVTLRKSGGLANGIRFVAVGTRVRAVLGVRYAKYQVGRRKVLPSSLPVAWRAAIDAIAQKEISRAL